MIIKLQYDDSTKEAIAAVVRKRITELDALKVKWGLVRVEQQQRALQWVLDGIGTVAE